MLSLLLSRSLPKTLHKKNCLTFLPGLRGLVRVAHHQDVVPAAEGVPVHRAREQEDLRVVAGGLAARGAVVVPLGEVGRGRGLLVEGAGLAAEVLLVVHACVRVFLEEGGERERDEEREKEGRGKGEFIFSGLEQQQQQRAKKQKVLEFQIFSLSFSLSLSHSLPRPSRRSRRTRP